MPPTPMFLNLLVKPSSSMCNMRCRYCFYEDESSRRIHSNLGQMKADTARRLISSAADFAGHGGTAAFCFQGGEPTLSGLEFYKSFIEYEKNFPYVKFTHSIQTNGYLIDDSWASFLKENRFLVGVSIDGTQGIHDANRIDAAGNGTYHRVAEAVGRLARHKADVNALCVVTNQCAAHPHRVYRALKDMGFSYIQFIPCLDPLGEERGTRSYSLAPEDYGTFLCAVFDDWHADWERGAYTSVRQFDDYIHLMLGRPPSSCAAAGRCGGYLAVEADGSLYPCDFYVLDEWRIGKIAECSIADAMKSETAKRFMQEGMARPARCAGCQWLRICRGGCRRDLSIKNGTLDNHYCGAYQLLFSYAFKRLEIIAHEEAEAMRRLKLQHR